MMKDKSAPARKAALNFKLRLTWRKLHSELSLKYINRTELENLRSTSITLQLEAHWSLINFPKNKRNRIARYFSKSKTNLCCFET